MNEPATVLTDYVLAAVALRLAWRLSRSGARPPAPALLWAASFTALGSAALAGGTWHGIPRHLLPALRDALWSATYVAIGLADLLILAGAAWAALARRPRIAVLALLTTRFLIYAHLVVERRDFRYVVYEFGGTLLILLVFALELGRRREAAAVFVLGGVLVSSAGALALAAGIELHAHFNRNDLYHVVQTAGIWLFFKAGLLLRHRDDPSVSWGTFSLTPGKRLD